MARVRRGQRYGGEGEGAAGAVERRGRAGGRRSGRGRRAWGRRRGRGGKLGEEVGETVGGCGGLEEEVESLGRCLSG